MGERQAAERLRQILGRIALALPGGARNQVIGADLLGPQADSTGSATPRQAGAFEVTSHPRRPAAGQIRLLTQAITNRPGFALLVVVKPCRLPMLSDHFRRCELFGIPEEAARLRFRAFMETRGAPDTAAFPGKVVAVSNIPIRVPTHFMGR